MGAAALRHKLDAGSLRFLRLHRLPSGATASNMPGGVATMGVLVSVGDYTADRGGSFYWRLSDLHPTTPSTLRVKLDWAKAPPLEKLARGARLGEVYLLTNPALGSSSSGVGVAGTITRPAQLQRVGRAAQLGECRAISRQGRGCGGVCGAIINRQLAEYCAGHLAAATRPPKTDRMDLGSARPLPPPKRPRADKREPGARPPLQPGIWAAKGPAVKSSDAARRLAGLDRPQPAAAAAPDPPARGCLLYTSPSPRDRG